MKLKYRITIGNILVSICILLSIYIELTSKNPNDLIGAGYLRFYSIFIFLGDIALQWFIESNKKILWVEGVALAAFIIISYLP